MAKVKVVDGIGRPLAAYIPVAEAFIMKKFVSVLIFAMCLMLVMPALASGVDAASLNLTVNGGEVDGSACNNAEGGLCLEMLPVAEALGYSVDKSELEEGDAYRIVYTLTPSPAEDGSVGAQLMVAYSIEDEAPSAVAISKDQVLLPLKQSMTLKDGKPYLPTEFFETGMCVTFTLDGDTQTLDIISVSCNP
jgi:hypothetical protein